MTKSEIKREISERRNEWIKLETRYSPEFELDSDEIVPKDWTSLENAMVLLEEMINTGWEVRIDFGGVTIRPTGSAAQEWISSYKDWRLGIAKAWLKYDDGRKGNVK